MVPLCLHFIGPHLYGVWLASGGILGMLGVMNLGLGSLLIQRVAKAYGQQDFPKVADYFINGLVVYLILTAAFIVVGLLISFGLTHVLKDVGDDKDLLRHCFQLALVAAGLGIVNECLRGFAHALLRPLCSTLALAGSRIFGLVATLILLYRETGLWAIPMGMLLTEGLALLFGLIQTAVLFRGLGVHWNLNVYQIREYFRVGGMLFASRLGQSLSREADPLLIGFFMLPEMTAAYMLTRRAADIVFQMLAILYNSIHGTFSHLAGAERNSKTSIVAAQALTLIYFVAVVGFAAYVAMNTSFVTLWVGESFVLDQGLILLIGLAYFLNILRNMVLQLLNGLGEFNMSSRVILLEGLTKTGLAAWLLSWIGLPGVPLALAAVCAVTLIVLGMKLHEKIRLPIAPRYYTWAFIASVTLFGLASILPNYMMIESWWCFSLYATGCMFAAISITMLLNRGALKSLVKANQV